MPLSKLEICFNVIVLPECFIVHLCKFSAFCTCCMLCRFKSDHDGHIHAILMLARITIIITMSIASFYYCEDFLQRLLKRHNWYIELLRSAVIDIRHTLKKHAFPESIRGLKAVILKRLQHGTTFFPLAQFVSVALTLFLVFHWIQNHVVIIIIRGFFAWLLRKDQSVVSPTAADHKN
jgi:hypothetical protein